MVEANGRGKIGVFDAAFLGVGAMVGAGIFALLGEAGAIAGSAVWLSFLIAGVIAMLQGYSFAKLGTRYPSRGGTIEFLVQGFGNGHVTGIVSWLFYVVGQVITVMVALSFGSYAGILFFGEDVAPEATKLLALVIIAVMALLNLQADREGVARVQTAIVWVVIVILGGFAFITIRNADFSLLSPANYPPARSIISSVALTFFAFLGFAVVAFSAGDMENPRRDLPKAMYLSLIITTVLYVAIAIGVYGTPMAPRSALDENGSAELPVIIARRRRRPPQSGEPLPDSEGLFISFKTTTSDKLFEFSPMWADRMSPSHCGFSPG